MTTTWTPLGPAAIQTADFGLVTGRVSAIALDPSDPTGNKLYVGTTGGGVWMANNAGVSTPASIVFSPLTDGLALGGATDASISIGALTVQPGETGVILAGTGDPNDSLDSYYGAGILRSTDGGNTWALIAETSDAQANLAPMNFGFAGEGFAGFAWSTVNPQVVVAAVSQAFEGTLVDAELASLSYEGLYYSADSGATWHLATITDGGGNDVQGPRDAFVSPDGNAATAVVWNPVRQLFIAAVRYHGYYQSADGVAWTRMTAQPGAGLTAPMCPANPGETGSIACPIFRGALAVNPVSGDTFAWSVDLNDQDQGLWQDRCAISGGACTNATVTFAQQWSTAALETNTLEGAVTIADGVYNLALAAVPSQQDTLVMAGANDWWKCSLAMGCVWRNTTNSTTCMSAQVGEFQHAVAWNAANPLEIFLGNDSGLWRSTDAIGESGPVCSASDATHFQNLNGSIGSLAEAESVSPVLNSPYVMMAGLGVNGFAGVKSTAATTDWPQILSGFGGPLAVDPADESNWYVNDQSGVAIYACAQSGPCTPASFGTTPVVTDADVGGDGDAMPTPAPFLVDAADASQLLVGTCRVWRGPADGAGWSASNAISPILDSGATAGPCSGDSLISAMAATKLANGSEVIYVGTYGSAFNGSRLPGHVLSAMYNPAQAAMPAWNDLTMNPVANDAYSLNYYGYGISSVTIDPHDATGNTVYVTVEGIANLSQAVRVIYRSTNGGATWTNISANLPETAANSVAVDPQNANTVYVATDAGVFLTTQAASCAQTPANCWATFGDGLPAVPAVVLSAASATAAQQMLVAATYGRGIWQTALWSSSTAITSATANPANVVFTKTPAVGVASQPIAVQLTNTGSLALTVTSIAMQGSDPGDFGETDNCQAGSVAVGGSCTINVTFTPQVASEQRTAVMTIDANVYGGQVTADLSGTGTVAAAVSLSPNPVNFSPQQVGTTSAPLQITVANSGPAAVPITSLTVTAPFAIASNACGTTSLAAETDCQIEVDFAPTQTGAATGLLTLVDTFGTQTVALNGTGQAPPTDILNPASLTFAATAERQLSAAQPVTITNTGDLPLTGIAIGVSAEFQETNNCTTQLAAGAVCTINVQFAPTQLGAVTGALTIGDALRTQTVSLSGTGTTPGAISVNPTSLTFTSQQPGVASVPQALTITNSGGAALANIGFQLTGSAAASYAISTTTCGALLNSGASCTAQVVFTPSGTGAIAATLVISTSTLGVAAVNVPLNGFGQFAGGLTANPTQLNFAVVGAGQTSSAQSVTLTNSSAFATGTLTLAAPAPFSITQNSCTGGLAAGASCTAGVIFGPTAPGAASGTLTATAAGVAAPVTVALTGAGFDFAIALSGPASETVASGQQANYTLVITPYGAGGSFSFVCGTLPPNAQCVFNPTSETLSVGVRGNVEVEIATGSGSSVRLERRSLWPAAPMACALLLLPLAMRKRRRIFVAMAMLTLLTGGATSCVSSGGGTGGTGGSGGGSRTTPGTYTIPVTVTANGVSHEVNLTLTVD